MIQHPWNGPFLELLGPYSPKYCSILLKFSNKTKAVFEKSLKILNFGSNGMHPKFTVLVHFGAQFTTRKPKKLLKTKIYAKTASLGIPNNVSPRSQKNHRILVKLSKKKTFFGPNCPLGPYQRVFRNSYIAYNRTVHLYFLNAKFQLLGICYSWLSLEETAFFWFRTQLGPFWGVWEQQLK